ncbi:MAG: IS1096 element passenger TnpR family protein, partial [Gaiellaceae bacterium]
VLAVQAVLVPYAPFVDWPAEPVVRTVAVREDQTLEQLHEALRLAFGWADPHMYAFWMSGKWWDKESVKYQTPFELDPLNKKVQSGRVPLAEIGLRKGKAIAYLFDFGDEWRLLLKVVDRWEADDGSYPMLVEATGTPPPQYAPLEDEELEDSRD